MFISLSHIQMHVYLLNVYHVYTMYDVLSFDHYRNVNSYWRFKHMIKKIVLLLLNHFTSLINQQIYPTSDFFSYTETCLNQTSFGPRFLFPLDTHKHTKISKMFKEFKYGKLSLDILCTNDSDLFMIWIKQVSSYSETCLNQTLSK